METNDQNRADAGVADGGEVERLKAEVQREHELYLRALADHDNYRRRVERERSSAAQSGKREIILPLLEVLDGFDRALEHMSDAPQPVVDGFKALHRQLLALLSAHGVTPLASIGEIFNPAVHEAIGTVQSDQLAPDTVAEELQRGYRCGDDVLRPARVRVAR
jgi:molecular chaperone GrpE